MLEYFDLNRDMAGQKRITTLNVAIPTKTVGQPKETGAKLSTGQQVLMYIGVLVGVIFSSAVGQFKTGQPVTFQMNAANIAVAAVIALLLIPFVYKQIQPNNKAPFIVQFGLFVQHGVFWQVIFTLIGKTVG